MESLAPRLLHGTDSMELLLDCMPAGTHVLLCDPSGSAPGRTTWSVPSTEFLEASWAAAAVGGQAPDRRRRRAFRTLADVREHAAALHQPWWTVSPFGSSRRSRRVGRPRGWSRRRRGRPDTGDAIALAAQPVPLYHGDTARLAADLRGGRRRLGVALVFEGHGTAQRPPSCCATPDSASPG
jgi:transcription-repair coupling factor (superfamily II helicase)